MTSKKISVNIVKNTVSDLETRKDIALEKQLILIQKVVKENDILNVESFKKEVRIENLETVIKKYQDISNNLLNKNKKLEELNISLETRKDKLSGTEQNLFAILSEIGKSLTDEEKDELRKNESSYCEKYDIDISRY